ncbi:MopE-related protein [Sandaracinus amylolyticus]|uniref:MopE-related protein n=1 Tax=Sandaracinus amylolyticus TaxID=927083 RepID=UPI001F29F0FC|nr:MopE-related protein [Sandaracinus amylolyticus]UJR78695.1 Tryptophan synthase alpha chain [Sandaracinus amylolyticus]
MRLRSYVCALLLVASAACGGDDDDDGVVPGADGSTPGGLDGSMVRTDGGGGCVPAIEICGDRMDQNCDGRDTSCGDTDGDGIEACRAGDDLTRCDCDDGRTDVRPPFGSLAGAPELCDDRDNDCDGRVDESAQCCEGCASLDDRARADVCTEDGSCDCSTAPGVAPCAAGQTCCAGGCVDLQSDMENCGYCGTTCTQSADRCTAGECHCGTGPVCDLDYVCTGGSC